MKKKSFDDSDYNFLSLRSDNPFVDPAAVHIIGDKVFIETEDQSICLSAGQAKLLTNFLHDRIVRPPVTFDDFGRNDHDE